VLHAAGFVLCSHVFRLELAVDREVQVLTQLSPAKAETLRYRMQTAPLIAGRCCSTLPAALHTLNTYDNVTGCASWCGRCVGASGCPL